MERAHRHADAQEVEALLLAPAQEALDVAAAMGHAEEVVDRVAEEEDGIAVLVAEAEASLRRRPEEASGFARRHLEGASRSQLRVRRMRSDAIGPATGDAWIEAHLPDAAARIESPAS